MKFTLKVIHDKSNDLLIPDTRHPNGGSDFEQAAAFEHLIPEGFIYQMYEEKLRFLAGVHGWDCSIEDCSISPL